MTLVRSRIRIRFDHLELARGHDGFLRGKPEPTLVLGVYLVAGEQQTRLLTRNIFRFGVSKPLPCRIRRSRPLLSNRYYEHLAGAHFVVLAMAVEEDSGTDVQQLYGLLDRMASISVWSPEAAMPTPLHIEELPDDDQGWWTPYRVSVLANGIAVGEQCKGDDWVDASLAIVPTETRHDRELRMHFVSKDERNDWTAQLSVRFH